ncbi:TMV resistance protein N-like [Quercus lobata]|uniref:TMV resistance protein N-like n=1 Tax=Quercus lobata TaxID=97700 RepID=UPI00124857BB|nr:TMV resistance protein N-like [Quercus lobata]XP_030948226.1 TMV resistance protein N-like [Quercus lobata]XP_030948227.1 TMV resistance protein N-like [Quercus lobata]XP_030948228.1 TMV resistance protein N-like [Quercus lobata]XP_030948229.1 TMV resistance protein N-like [Quercus lobata]
MASSSSSFPSSSVSSTSKWTYDVFLSFSGEDTRNTATDFIYYALEEKGIKTFKDDRNLERGKTIKPELLKAIKESKFAVVILSKNYASSTWCLDELVEIIDCEEKKEISVLPIFYNVDPSDVRKQIGTFAHVFDEHEKQFKEKLETWKAALSQVANIAGYHVKNSPLSEAVKSIVGVISRKLSGEFSEATEGLVGMESPMLELESCLAFNLKDEVRFIGIWAMGGMGKTTLAEVAYKMFSKEFEGGCCFIHNVREKYEKEGELSLQKDLISQIFNDTNLNIKNKCEGEQMIKSRLCGRRILLILDDVYDSNQLQKLAGKREWFGRCSRIIITTRDKQLLRDLGDQIYEVKLLKYEDALCLFSSKAFNKKHAPSEYLKPSQAILEYVNGVPLALDILGSFLSGRSLHEWEEAIKRLKEEPNEKVNQALKISYDGLQASEKEIFLDIACFFNHEVKAPVEQILEILGRRPRIGLEILIEKSLLKISGNSKLWMHDLLRDMGRDIVRQKSRHEPGEWSRLWLYEDIDRVLRNNTGTKEVQAMDISGAEACGRGFTFSKNQKRPQWKSTAFSKLSNLKFLRVHNVFPQPVPGHLPNSLIHLEWSGYSAKSLPCFQPNELVQLHLQNSKIEFLWEGVKNFDRLKSINMAGSSNLIKAPNFKGVPNLEELVLEGCSKLRTLDPSIGKLKNLKLLNLKKCQKLTSLPNKIEWKSLVTLNFIGCSKVKKIPEFVGNMTHLQELILLGTAITKLPSSVKCLTGLTLLDLTYCKKFEFLPSTICSLKSLEKIFLLGCSKFDKLPKDFGNITSLTYLNFSGTAIKELPSSIEFLNGLKVLALKDCKKFVRLPSTVCSLKSLEAMYLSRCPKFVNLPEDLGNLELLSRLCLKGTAIEVLPSSVGHLAALVILNLKYCKNLVRLPSTICNLKRLDNFKLAGCSKITNLPENLGNMESLRVFSLDGTAIKELPPSTIHLEAPLSSLSFKGCQLSSSSLTSIPRARYLYLNDCNLSAIPSGIDRNLSISPYFCGMSLYLSGNDFVSLPESISQVPKLESLYLDGCKSLRSLSNFQIPSTVEFLCVDNCTSLERLPEGPEPLHDGWKTNFTVQCFNCFKLAENFENISNMFQGHRSHQFEICCIIPGREIPKWFEKCDTSVDYENYKRNTVKIQLPGSGSGCDEWRGIVLCVGFLPIERQPRYRYRLGDGRYYPHHGIVVYCENCSPYCTYPEFSSVYGEVESHHLWLHSMSKNEFRLPKTPGRSIDKKGYHQVVLVIESWGLEVEKIGFRVV